MVNIPPRRTIKDVCTDTFDAGSCFSLSTLELAPDDDDDDDAVGADRVSAAVGPDLQILQLPREYSLHPYLHPDAVFTRRCKHKIINKDLLSEASFMGIVYNYLPPESNRSRGLGFGVWGLGFGVW